MPRTRYETESSLSGPLQHVTSLLQANEQNEAAVTEELLPLVLHEFRRLAASRIAVEIALEMAEGMAGHTLQPIALVHDFDLRTHL